MDTFLNTGLPYWSSISYLISVYTPDFARFQLQLQLMSETESPVPQIPQRPKRASKQPSATSIVESQSIQPSVSPAEPVIPLRPKKKSIEPSFIPSQSLNAEENEFQRQNLGKVEELPSNVEKTPESIATINEQLKKEIPGDSEISGELTTVNKLHSHQEASVAAVIPPRPVRSKKTEKESETEALGDIHFRPGTSGNEDNIRIKEKTFSEPIVPKRPLRGKSEEVPSAVTPQDTNAIDSTAEPVILDENKFETEKISDSSQPIQLEKENILPETSDIDSEIPHTSLATKTEDSPATEESLDSFVKTLAEPANIPDKLPTSIVDELVSSDEELVSKDESNDKVDEEAAAKSEHEVSELHEHGDIKFEESEVEHSNREHLVQPQDESQPRSVEAILKDTDQQVEEQTTIASEQKEEDEKPTLFSPPIIPTRPVKHSPEMPRRPSKPSKDLSGNVAEEKASPAISSSVVKSGDEIKKAPPLKPKKLSSKIAAFQQMFNQPAPEPSKPEKDYTRNVKTGKLSSDKKDFAANLQNMMGRGIALPGMANPEMLRKLSGGDNEDKGEEDDVQGSAAPSIPRRTRGPKGKRLPKSIQETTLTVESPYKVSVHEVWDITFHKREPKPGETEVVEEDSEGDIIEESFVFEKHDNDFESASKAFEESNFSVAGSPEIITEGEEEDRKASVGGTTIRSIDEVELAIEELKESREALLGISVELAEKTKPKATESSEATDCDDVLDEDGDVCIVDVEGTNAETVPETLAFTGAAENENEEKHQVVESEVTSGLD